MQDTDQLRKHPDATLIKNLEALSLRENEATLEILLQLMELEERKLHLTLGFGSLFAYCRGKLHYSEGAANRRIKAAKCIKAHPKVYELLKQRRVSLSTVCIFSAVLTHENEGELLAKVAGLGQADVERVVAEYREPTERARDVVRVVSKGAAVSKNAPFCPESNPAQGPAPIKCDSPATPPQALAAASVFSVEPPAEGPKGSEVIQRYSFSAGEKFEETLTKMRALLSNKHPRGAGLEELFFEAMSFYLKAHTPKVKEATKPGQVAKEAVKDMAKGGVAGSVKGEETTLANQNLGGSQVLKVESNTYDPVLRPDITYRNVVGVKEFTKRSTGMPLRHIPVAVKAAVHKRDEGCCSFVAAGGKRCGSTWGLEFDHIVPFAKGGGSTVANVRLLGRRHNAYLAERVFGRDYVATKVWEARRRGDAAAATVPRQ